MGLFIERNIMGKKKAKKVSVKDSLKAGFYKGYDIKWLKREPKHPDYYLVAEYESKYGERE